MVSVRTKIENPPTNLKRESDPKIESLKDMIRHTNVLIFCFSLLLAAAVAVGLYSAVAGLLIPLAGAFVGRFAIFALLVVLLQERRVLQIMDRDNYDKEQKPL